MPGIALINKPCGMTSHDVVNIVRHKTGIKRVGHSGTLDPLATGLLIVLVGREYTKKQDQFLKQNKEYICRARLGVTTDTYDIEGQTTQQTPWDDFAELTQDQLATTLKSFVGKINQTVPAYSAIKLAGKKLYQKARAGTLNLADLPSRDIEIFSIEMTKFEKDLSKKTIEFEFICNCSSGTYIRSLVFDIGRKLGCGATLLTLIRTKIGELSLDQAQELIKGQDLVFLD